MPVTVLAVDDNDVNLNILTLLLEDEFNVVTARDGAETLVQADAHEPALILLDVNLPDIDGFEVCRRLRQNPRHENRKIVFVSAKALSSERQAGFDAGGDDYVTKPFNHDELLAKVRSYVQETA